MPNGPDQRPSRNRRPRRRSQSTNRLPVTEQDEVAELEAARERNDLDVRDLREMSVKELREVGVPVTYVTVEGSLHSIAMLDDAMRERILEFLRAAL